MPRVLENWHYVVKDCRGVIQGYFKTKGLAHQYLIEEYPTPNSKGYQKTRLTHGPMYVKKVRRR